jgi:hypothetical protein
LVIRRHIEKLQNSISWKPQRKEELGEKKLPVVHNQHYDREKELKKRVVTEAPAGKHAVWPDCVNIEVKHTQVSEKQPHSIRPSEVEVTQGPRCSSIVLARPAVLSTAEANTPMRARAF